MSDLIDRQKALNELKYEMKYGAVIDGCGLDTAYDIIKDLPSAESERTAKVENIAHVRGYPAEGTCGNCGFDVEDVGEYCAGCGAKLDWSGYE